MNILVINGHPDAGSFCESVFAEFVRGLNAKKHKIETLELGKMDFDPVLRFGYRKRMPEDAEILRSQELLKWADHLVFVYPIWWSGMPSLMKGWIDRVFTPGIAYSSNTDGSFLLNYLLGRQFKHLLKGKTAEIISTSMGPAWWSRLFGGPISVSDSYGVAVLKSAVLVHSGIKTKKVLILGNMGRKSNTPEIREKFLQKVHQRAEKI